MRHLELRIDGTITRLDPGPLESDTELLVPIETFAVAVDAEAKEIDGRWAVCRGDLCTFVDADPQQTVDIEGVVYASLSSFGDSLGLGWSVTDNGLSVTTDGSKTSGLNPGQRPPSFVLPDLFTGEQVSMEDYYGRKTAFFMWASW